MPHQAIGHSSKAPSPNLKKLTIPASTAATMTIFFPWRSAMKGLGLTCAGSGVDCVERINKYDSNLAKRDGGLATVPVGGDGLDAEVLIAGAALRLRGRGGGMVGRPSYMCESSASVGIGVVRALERKAETSLSTERKLVRKKRAHLTTTIEKSGWGGAVFR